jgi:hypothetical protein
MLRLASTVALSTGLALFALGTALVPQLSAAERQLAKGVLTTIPPSFQSEDTVSTHDVMELKANPAIAWKPEYFAAADTLLGMSNQVKFRR